jgi:metal-dependent HD superfamily phosphatase/phosphodiesterase
MDETNIRHDQLIDELGKSHPDRPEAAAKPSGRTLPISVHDLAKDPEVAAYIEAANANLGVLRFTEHGTRHANLVASIARNILRRLDYEPHLQELAAIAGYLHDIGNVVSRYDHGTTGALLSREILVRQQVAYEDVALILGAIGSHGDDSQRLGEAVHPVSAALILADKSDVHRSRVREKNRAEFDQHDRLNYASESSFLRVDKEQRRITLELTIDTTISQVMNYFEIYLPRMVMCRRAAEFLGCQFGLEINESMLL